MNYRWQCPQNMGTSHKHTPEGITDSLQGNWHCSFVKNITFWPAGESEAFNCLKKYYRKFFWLGNKSAGNVNGCQTRDAVHVNSTLQTLLFQSLHNNCKCPEFLTKLLVMRNLTPAGLQTQLKNQHKWALTFKVREYLIHCSNNEEKNRVDKSR